MTAKVRADFPLYPLHPEGMDFQRSQRGVRIDEGTVYLMPVTFGLSMSF